MPRTGITAYDLLISCPGDVLQYADVVKECVETFNHTLGRLNNSEIVTRHWSTDSFPQSGDRPQELLNKQFVRDCDAAVAIFWTRFGTSTDKYDSGTEEEIAEMLSSGKQVFLYFVDAPISPSNINQAQYQKVNDFKEKYRSGGLYSAVKSEDDFRTQFSNHLTMYFLPLMTGEKPQRSGSLMPALQIQDYNSGDINTASVYQSDFVKSKFIVDQSQDICIKVTNLQKTCLPQRTPKKEEDTPTNVIPNKSYELAKALESTKGLFGIGMDADIPEKWKSEILKFAKSNGLELDDSFWHVGNLKKRTSFPTLPYGNSGISLEGTDEEKQRYESMQDLYWAIIEYEEYTSYFSQVDAQKFVELVVANVGTSFDEDVDVKLYIPKGCTIPCECFPIPEINIIERILDMRFLESVYEMKPTSDVGRYSDYVPSPVDFDYQIPDLLRNTSAMDEYKQHKHKYAEQLERIISYQMYEKDDNDILMFHISYIKHNTKMALPSVLVFGRIPEKIEYEITSKHVPDIIKGHINLG